MNTQVKSIAIGIRHKRMFKIRDSFGKFIDTILNHPESPFKDKYFPFLDESPQDSVVLHNKDHENFQISIDDLIIKLNNKDDFDDKILYIKDQVLPFIKKRIFGVITISNILRIGIVFSLEIETKDKINEWVAKFTENNIKTANKFELKFSKKIVVEEALVKKGINDYINNIYLLVKKENKLLINFDYQRYFDPELPDINDFNLDKFIDSAVLGLKDTHEKWLNKYEEKQGDDDAKDISAESQEANNEKGDVSQTEAGTAE